MRGMRRFLSILLIEILVFDLAFPVIAEDKKLSIDERQSEIEKAIFMASGIQERIIKIGLVDCIAYALKNNSEILIQRIEPKLKEDDVKIAKGDFEPTFGIDYNFRDNAKSSSSALAGASISKTQDMDYNAKVSGKFVTGTEYALEFINERIKSNSSFQSINPSYATEPKITITQPLFRDFGILVNTADITIARNNKTQEQEDFRETVMDAITKTKVSFYDYMFNLQSYAIAESSLVRAKDLLEINKARYEKGLNSSVDLLEAESAVAEREKALISSEGGLKKAEDDLKLITNLVDDPQTWNAKIELLDDSPQFKEESVSLLKSLQSAFMLRPDYKSEKIDLKNRDIKIATAKNALLPTIDLITSFGLNGLGKDYPDSLEKIDSDFRDYSVGFKVSIPWGGAERAEFDQRNLEKAQALLSFKRLEQKIILEVRDKVRELDLEARKVKASKLNLDVEEKNYAAQKERYAAGQVSTHDMLEYQEKLSQAELDYKRALIDYNVAVINLDKSQGLTLVRNSIILEE